METAIAPGVGDAVYDTKRHLDEEAYTVIAVAIPRNDMLDTPIVFAVSETGNYMAGPVTMNPDRRVWDPLIVTTQFFEKMREKDAKRYFINQADLAT